MDKSLLKKIKKIKKNLKKILIIKKLKEVQCKLTNIIVKQQTIKQYPREVQIGQQNPTSQI